MVFLNTSEDCVRLTSELTSSAFCGSSTMTQSAPNPVIAPLTEIARRLPFAVVVISSWLFSPALSTVPGKTLLY